MKVKVTARDGCIDGGGLRGRFKILLDVMSGNRGEECCRETIVEGIKKKKREEHK